MNRAIKIFVTTGLLVTAFLGLAPGSAMAQGLEIRVAPSDLIYSNENNRRIGIYDIMVQTIAIVNRSSAPLTLQEILIEAVEEGDVILTDRLLASNYEAVWNAFYPGYSNPDAQAANDTLTLYSLAVPEGYIDAAMPHAMISLSEEDAQVITIAADY